MRYGLLVFVLLLFTPSPELAAGAACQADRDGVTYCVVDGGQTHLLIVDLNNPAVRVQTVMANDVLDVWPPEEQRERVVDVVKRYRAQRAQNVIAAINGDYFGAGRGPEGLTAVQGQRLDTVATIAANPSRYRRTTLAVNRLGAAAIGHLNPINSLAPTVYRDLLFNAISGGPIILLNGQSLPEDLACFLDRIPISTCRRDRQSVAGVDETGRTLFLAASTTRSTRGMAELLREHGALTAMKLDAGGSSQLWYRGRALVDSSRGVANALLILREDRPRHAAELMARPPVLVLDAGAQDIVYILLRNTGYLPWSFDRYYGLQKTAGGALAEGFARLLIDVPPEAIGAVPVTIQAPSQSGVFSSTWRLALPGDTFGPAIPLPVVVIPRGANELRQPIQAWLDRMARLSDKQFAQAWPATAVAIREIIAAWQHDHTVAMQSEAVITSYPLALADQAARLPLPTAP